MLISDPSNLKEALRRAEAEIGRLRAALQEIQSNYANHDMSHADFRVGAGQAAWNALNPIQTP